eukprot:9493821-Pyramimonas_sp.AAC.1
MKSPAPPHGGHSDQRLDEVVDTDGGSGDGFETDVYWRSRAAKTATPSLQASVNDRKRTGCRPGRTQLSSQSTLARAPGVGSPVAGARAS